MTYACHCGWTAKADTEAQLLSLRRWHQWSGWPWGEGCKLAKPALRPFVPFLTALLLAFSACAVHQPVPHPSLAAPAPLVWTGNTAKRGALVVGLLVQAHDGWYAFAQDGAPAGPPGKLLGGPFPTMKQARKRADMELK